MRVIRKILTYIGLFIVVILASAVVLGKVFEDELSRYIVEQLNRHIRTEATVENIRLSFLSRFPDASLELSDVLISSVTGYNNEVFEEENTDTLLSVRKISFRFDVLKLFRKQYLIKQVELESGNLNLLVDDKGNGNYIFWDRKKKGEGNDFLLDMDNVSLNDIKVRFDNRALGLDIRGLVEKCYFSGNFYQEVFEMEAGIEGRLQEYSNAGTIFFQNQSLVAGASLEVEPKAIGIYGGSLKIGGQEIQVSGEILRPQPLELKLDIAGKELDLEKVLKHIMALSKNYPEELNAGGKFNFQGSVNGIIDNTSMPLLEAGFELNDGWINTPDLKREIRDIRTKGRYSNGAFRAPKSTSIQLEGLSMRYGKSRIGGNYSVHNLVSPRFKYEVKTELYLEEIQDFIKENSLIDSLSGKILAEIYLEGDHSILKKITKEEFLDYEYHANIRLEDAGLKLKVLPLAYRHFTGDAVFTDHLNISSLRGEVGNNDLSISGRIDNFFEFLLTGDGNLWMDVDLYTERLDLNFLKSLNLANKDSDGADTIFLPERIYLKSKFWCDELEIREFKASQVTGNLIYQPRRLSINNIELLSLGGKIVSEGMLEQQNEQDFLVKCLSTISSVDITKAFSSFGNFGQQFIKDEHLKGSVSGMVNFSAKLDQRMKIQKESILADCDVLIKNGELNSFEPMLKLSKFIDVEELENVKFSTLSNEIFIRDQEVLIPKMDIRSSAFEIAASGIHGFDMNFTYKLKVSLSDILAAKHGKASRQESEYGVIEDDGLGKMYIYLIAEGSPLGTDIRYDRIGAMQSVREDIKQEKNELKEILNEEFGLFKNDSSVFNKGRKLDNNSENQRLIIEWDDGETVEENQAAGIKEKQRKKRKKQ